MEEIKLISDDVYEQIKDFDRGNLTEEQASLIDKLIFDEELKKYYKEYGLCYECKQPKNNVYWCRICAFQQNFKNWTSGNDDVDKFIQKSQLKAEETREILEWIEHDRFKMLNIWPNEVLELFIRQFGKMVRGNMISAKICYEKGKLKLL